MSATTPPRPWVLAESSWPAVRAAAYEVAILPWGATEAHNTHLPYATDNIETEGVAIEAARLAWEAKARVVVLPTIPFGVQTGQADLPLCINLDPSTQSLILRDIARSVAGSGIKKLVVLNGHGGNSFRQHIRELQGRLPLLICEVNWYRCGDPAAHFSVPGDHAGELETSVVQYLTPGLVAPLSTAGAGKARRFKIRALREGWAWTPRKWTDATSDTGDGDPRAATPEKGRKYFEAATRQVADFLVELAAADAAALYE